jgi:hypothetical protein
MIGPVQKAEAQAPEHGPGADGPGPAERDDREAMLAEQMAACHRVVLDCLGRAEGAGEAETARHGELRLAARFMTLFLRQSGALDRHRDHIRRAREAAAKAGRDSLNREVALANAQGRGFADGLEASLRRFEQAERARRTATAQGGETLMAEDSATPPTAETARAPAEPDPLPYPTADDLEGWIDTFAAPQGRPEAPAAETPSPKPTRQQRRAAERAQQKAARAVAARAGW